MVETARLGYQKTRTILTKAVTALKSDRITRKYWMIYRMKQILVVSHNLDPELNSSMDMWHKL